MPKTVTYTAYKNTAETLTRLGLRGLLKRHGYGPVRIAEMLGIKHAGVSNWFKGQNVSDRIDRQVRKLAAQCLKAEAKAKS